MRGHQITLGWIGFACIGFMAGPPSPRAVAQSPESAIEMQQPGESRLYVFRSDHFELYTDLEPLDTLQVLDKIEAVASNLGAYWGRPLKGKIKCFIANDLKAWPENLLSDPNGRAKIAERSGMTVLEQLATDSSRPGVRPVVYAFADGHNPQREVVRAFCLQTFGNCGPDWYAQGIAQVGAFWQKEGGAHCPAWMADYLRTESSTASSIVTDRSVQDAAWKVAAHRWALCYMLTTHPRYSGRFRQFGCEQLTGETLSFDKHFPELGPQLDADYREFLTRLKVDHETAISAVTQ